MAEIHKKNSVELQTRALEKRSNLPVAMNFVSSAISNPNERTVKIIKDTETRRIFRGILNDMQIALTTSDTIPESINSKLETVLGRIIFSPTQGFEIADASEALNLLRVLEKQEGAEQNAIQREISIALHKTLADSTEWISYYQNKEAKLARNSLYGKIVNGAVGAVAAVALGFGAYSALGPKNPQIDDRGPAPIEQLDPVSQIENARSIDELNKLLVKHAGKSAQVEVRFNNEKDLQKSVIVNSIYDQDIFNFEVGGKIIDLSKVVGRILSPGDEWEIHSIDKSRGNTQAIVFYFPKGYFRVDN